MNLVRGHRHSSALRSIGLQRQRSITSGSRRTPTSLFTPSGKPRFFPWHLSYLNVTAPERNYSDVSTQESM